MDLQCSFFLNFTNKMKNKKLLQQYHKVPRKNYLIASSFFSFPSVNKRNFIPLKKKKN